MDIWVNRCRLFCHSQWIYLDEYIQVTKHCSANLWTSFYMIGTSVMKELRRSLPTILWKSVFICRKAELAFFFSIWVFFHEYSRFKGQQVKGKAFSLYPFYHFHLFHRHLDIYRVIATGSSPLRIADIRQPLSNREPLAFWLKSRTIKLRTLENLLFLYLHC